MIARTIAAAAFACALVGVHAADAAPRVHRQHHGPHAIDPNNPPPEGAVRLLAFRGVWQFDGTVTIGNHRPRKMRWRLGCGSVAGGWALACDDTIRIPGQKVLREHDLFAFDPKTGVIHFYMADSLGEARELRGRWVDAKTLRYRYEGAQGGKRVVEEATIVLRGATTFDLDDKITVGGQPSIAFHGTFHQQPRRERPRRGARADAAGRQDSAAPTP